MPGSSKPGVLSNPVIPRMAGLLHEPSFAPQGLYSTSFPRDVFSLHKYRAKCAGVTEAGPGVVKK